MPDAGQRDIVLVVDDSPENLRLLTDALDKEGMSVLVALDGAAALRIVEYVTPDIILLDAVMPGMDGFETCLRLKRHPAVASVPVIFMTGLSETEHVVRGLKVGGVDYVAKPIVIEEMLARILVHLTNARLTKSARAALDATGRFLFAVDDAGTLVWATPQAQKLLSLDGIAPGVGVAIVPPSWLQWLELMKKGGGDPRKPPWAPKLADRHLRLQYIGPIGQNEFLLRLASDESLGTAAEFSRELNLTSREGEVLSWLSKGKTNRDIALILGLSSRTIDKHLEQIYVKLGVENRSAATAIAVKVSQGKGPDE